MINTTNIPKYILLFFLLSICIINIISFIKDIHNRKNGKYRISLTSYIIKNNFKFFAIRFNIYIILLAILLFVINNNSNTIYNENDISEKITTISNNLKETATELSIIQQQLEARIEFVENLQKEAEIAENVISLSEEQVNAVQSKINQELNASSGKSTITSFLISALFFTLGLIVQPIINFFRQKKNKHNNQENKDKQYNQEELLILLNEVKNAIESNDDKSSKN